MDAPFVPAVQCPSEHIVYCSLVLIESIGKQAEGAPCFAVSIDNEQLRSADKFVVGREFQAITMFGRLEITQIERRDIGFYQLRADMRIVDRQDIALGHREQLPFKGQIIRKIEDPLLFLRQRHLIGHYHLFSQVT